MRIAFVYDAVFPWVTGGVEKRVWEIARRLADTHDVHLFGFEYWEGGQTIEREGVTLHGVTEPPEDLYIEGRRNIWEAISFAGHLIRPLRRFQFDVIDCQSFPYFSCYSTRVATLSRESAMFITWHEVWRDYWYEYLGRKGVFGKIVEQFATRLTDRHIAVSRRTGQDLAELGPIEARHVPNGISLGRIREAPTANRPVDVLFAGRLIEEKNVDLLLRSMQLIANANPSIQCVIVGDGPRRRYLESLTAELGLEDNVAFTGFLDAEEDVLGLMKAANVFASPSRREGFGIAALESLASGTPVVTIEHHQNAVCELVDEGETGFICKPQARPFAQCLVDAIDELSEADCISAAEGYDWDVIANQAEKIYQEAT